MDNINIVFGADPTVVNIHVTQERARPHITQKLRLLVSCTMKPFLIHHIPWTYLSLITSSSAILITFWPNKNLLMIERSGMRLKLLHIADPDLFCGIQSEETTIKMCMQREISSTDKVLTFSCLF